jgi:predicted transcriptional regulator
MSGKYIQPHQTQSYMKGRELGHSQQESAKVANISERSGRRIETGQHQPKAGGRVRANVGQGAKVRTNNTL